MPIEGKFMLNFNFRMINPTPPPLGFTVGDELIILRLETTSPVTNNVLFLQLVAKYVGPNSWMPSFVNDQDPLGHDITAADLITSNWWVTASLSSSNDDMLQIGRIVVNNQAGTYKEVFPLAEAWDFTAGITLKYFSAGVVSAMYFQGTVGRIDFIGGQFDSSVSTTNDDITLDWKLPCRFSSNPRYPLLA